MKLQLLRNATLLLAVNDKTFLIDPMLGPKESADPIPNTENKVRNPLVDLPVSEAALRQLIEHVDVVLLTHLHNDHWDEAARALLPKDIRLCCPPENVDVVRGQGFVNVTAIDEEIVWEGIRITRTHGHHGTGEIEKLLGAVSGYVISYGADRLYLAGDTVWCEEVETAIRDFKPTHIVLNGGAARFSTGDPIIMNIENILEVCRHAPEANVYIVHMESLNHVTESRADVQGALNANGYSVRAFTPADGAIFIN